MQLSQQLLEATKRITVTAVKKLLAKKLFTLDYRDKSVMNRHAKVGRGLNIMETAKVGRLVRGLPVAGKDRIYHADAWLGKDSTDAKRIKTKAFLNQYAVEAEKIDIENFGE
jgi:hypothetical protein